MFYWYNSDFCTKIESNILLLVPKTGFCKNIFIIKNRDQMIRALKYIHKHLRILDQNNNNLILDKYLRHY